MGRTFGKSWDEAEIIKELKKVMKKLDMQTIPNERQLKMYGAIGLPTAVYKFGGFKYFRSKLDSKYHKRGIGAKVLTDEERMECVLLRKQGMIYREIAEKYKVSINCIVSVVLKTEAEEKKSLNKKKEVLTVEDKVQERKNQVKAICEAVRLQKEKDVEEMKARRIAEIEDCRWKGVFKI